MTQQEAILLLKEGNQQAFTILFEALSDKLVNYTFRFVKDREIAKELTQDVFMKVWISRSTIDASLSFEAWLFTIARHQLFNYLKRQLRQRQIYNDIAKNTPVALPADTHSYRDTLQTYLSTLAILPIQQKRVFLLSREEGLSYRQIAQELGISISAVEKHMMAALRTMRRNIHPVPLFLLLSLLYH